jgi:anti-anti-sigma factor
MFSVHLDVREYADYVVVALCGELDMADAAEVDAALTAAAAGGRKTIVDLAGLAFIDCTGVAALARAQRRVRQVGGSLLLTAPSPRVRRVFELSRLINGVSIHAGVEQATGFGQVSGLAAVSRPGVLSLSSGRDHQDRRCPVSRRSQAGMRQVNRDRGRKKLRPSPARLRLSRARLPRSGATALGYAPFNELRRATADQLSARSTMAARSAGAWSIFGGCGGVEWGYCSGPRQLQHRQVTAVGTGRSLFLPGGTELGAGSR